jgi:hypothetical protein
MLASRSIVSTITVSPGSACRIRGLIGNIEIRSNGEKSGFKTWGTAIMFFYADITLLGRVIRESGRRQA